ncbi:MAG: hypothetical protein GY715_11045, partial [Planctomycetes bacterium]|nr:hypothetical protein [Planctomycetota bacterium]
MKPVSIVALAGAAAISTGGVADTADLPAAADNTMYEGANHFSNGAGDHFFCGTNNGDFARRGLIRFDVAGALPAG